MKNHVVGSQTINDRIRQAEILWAQGHIAEQQKNYKDAYALYTAAHDLVADCARLHQHAHGQLRRINWHLGHYGELLTDWALHFFAPLGVFEMVSYFSRQSGWLHNACKRGVQSL